MGIFITTSYFQSGALKYAKEHGIALISIIAGSIIGVIILVVVGFFCYKAFIQKKEPHEDEQIEALMKD